MLPLRVTGKKRGCNSYASVHDFNMTHAITPNETLSWNELTDGEAMGRISSCRRCLCNLHNDSCMPVVNTRKPNTCTHTRKKVDAIS